MGMMFKTLPGRAVEGNASCLVRTEAARHKFEPPGCSNFKLLGLCSGAQGRVAAFEFAIWRYQVKEGKLGLMSVSQHQRLLGKLLIAAVELNQCGDVPVGSHDQACAACTKDGVDGAAAGMPTHSRKMRALHVRQISGSRRL